MEMHLEDDTAQDRSIQKNKSSVEFLYSGFNAIAPFQPGDFILIHRKMWFSRLIQFGQRIYYPKKYARWNHCVLVVSKDGNIIEALTKGVAPGHISKYKNYEYYLVRVNATDDDAQEILDYANYALTVHQKYSISIFMSLFFGFLLGSRFRFGRIGTTICSGLVATALTRTGAIFEFPPEYCTPADLAKYYKVDPKH